MSVSDLFSLKGKTALVTGGSRGIGLMIARGFVEAHHGEIRAANENGGARFTVRLPRAPVA